MSHGVHAVQHEVEHQIEHEEHGHGGGGHAAKPAENQNRKIALLIAVIALFLAFSETLGKSAQTAALSYNVEASNLWAFYQAKTIRRTTLEASTELLKFELTKIDGGSSNDALKKAMSDRIDNWTRATARYESEPMDRPVPHDVNLNPPYGVVLASSAVITGLLALAYAAAGLGVIGLIFTAIGLFAPHAVHLF
jgi:hypothetical protein